MGHQIIQQPDGRLAVFSSVVDAFVVLDATPEELVDWYAEEAAKEARERTQRLVERLLRDGPQATYSMRALTWEEAAEMDRKNAPEDGEEL